MCPVKSRDDRKCARRVGFARVRENVSDERCSRVFFLGNVRDVKRLTTIYAKNVWEVFRMRTSGEWTRTTVANSEGSSDIAFLGSE